MSDLTEPFGYPFGCPVGRMEQAIAGKMPSISGTFAAQAALWNRLVEIEAENRAAYRACIDGGDESAKGARIHVDLLEARKAAILAMPRKERDKDVLNETIAQIKAAKEAAKLARKSARDKLKSELDGIEKTRRAMVKQAVSDAGLWWCHSEVIVERYEVARVRAMKTNSVLHPARDPETFGMLRVRWQNGIPLAVLMEGDSLASLQVTDANSHRVRATLSLCVESDYRAKDYIAVPVVFSRPIPEGSVVRSICLFRRRVADRIRWYGSVVVKQPKIEAVHAGTESICLTQEGLRDDEHWTEAMKHVRWLHSVLDSKAARFFATVTDLSPADLDRLERILERRKESGKGGIIYPDFKHIEKPSPETAKFLADTERMWREMHHLRARACRRRVARYRLIAKDYATRYGTLTVEKPMMAFSRKTDDRPAWGEFCKILGQAVKKAGGTIEFFVPEKKIAEAAE